MRRLCIPSDAQFLIGDIPQLICSWWRGDKKIPYCEVLYTSIRDNQYNDILRSRRSMLIVSRWIEYARTNLLSSTIILCDIIDKLDAQESNNSQSINFFLYNHAELFMLNKEQASSRKPLHNKKAEIELIKECSTINERQEDKREQSEKHYQIRMKATQD